MAADIKAIETSPVVQTLRETAVARVPAPTTDPAGVPAADDRADAPRAVDVERLVERLRDYVQSMDREVQFTIDKESGYTVIKVIDPVNQKVIRQIPAEVTLRLARHLDKNAQGLLFADKA